jgi:hypothetical protein
MARHVGLQKAQLIMGNPQEGEGRVIFKSGDRYYYSWVQVNGSVCEIIAILSTKGEKGLKRKEIGSFG